MNIPALLALLGLLALNAVFVASEFALIRSRRERLEVEPQPRGAAAALRALEHLNQSLATCQLGVTMASIGTGFVGEQAIGSAVSPLLRGVVGVGLSTIIGVVFSYALITIVEITASEQVPKLYALQHPERILRVVARMLLGMHAALRPLVWLLNKMTSAGLRLLGANPNVNAHDDLPAPLSSTPSSPALIVPGSSNRPRRRCSPASLTFTSSSRRR